MNVTTESEARAWLQAWDWKPRKGILQVAMEGLLRCISISESQGGASASYGYRQAYLVLQQQQRHLERLEALPD